MGATVDYRAACARLKLTEPNFEKTGRPTMQKGAEHDGCCNAEEVDAARRRLLKGTAAIAAVGAVGAVGSANAATEEARKKYADPAEKGLPPSDMEIDPERTALVVIDPQVDFLSEKGTAWGGRRQQRHRAADRPEPREAVQGRQGRRDAGVHLAPLLLPVGPSS